jgi:hypothetical protein
VSSILEALKKVEAVERRPLDLPSSPSPPPRGRRIGTVLAIAFTAGAGLALWLRPAAHAPSTPVTPPTPPPASAPATPPAAHPAPAQVAAPPTPPANHVATPAPPRVVVPAPPPAPLAPPVAAAPAPPAPITEAPKNPPNPPPRVASQPTAPAPPGAVHASPGETVLSRPPAGAPRVQLSFLVYSQTPERRSVVLAIDGGSLVTLHEGETAVGLEVARILPDRVHLRMGGQVFAVRPRD